MSLTEVMAPSIMFAQERAFPGSSFLNNKHSKDTITLSTRQSNNGSYRSTKSEPVSKPAQAKPEQTNNTPERDPSMVIYDDFVRESVDKTQTITVGGRKSILAVAQSKNIAGSLYDNNLEKSFPVVALSTLGDKVLSKPLYSFGGKSLWTKELETLLMHDLEGLPKLDMIVHSLKDMPTALPEGCVLGAITEREDPRDAIIMKAGSPHVYLSDLADGSVVGTSSIRRSAQLKRNFPRLKFESVRGNVQTRLAKLDDPNSKFACIILAVAGLKRVGLGHRITSSLDAPDMYYAVGQGALGIEIRTGDEKIMKLLSKINHKESYLRCLAERALMRTLEGGCSVPIGVKTTFTDETLEFSAIVVSVDGTEAVEDCIRATVTTAAEAEDMGKLMAQKLIEKGAKKILDAIHIDGIH